MRTIYRIGITKFSKFKVDGVDSVGIDSLIINKSIFYHSDGTYEGYAIYSDEQHIQYCKRVLLEYVLFEAEQKLKNAERDVNALLKLHSEEFGELSKEGA